MDHLTTTPSAPDYIAVAQEGRNEFWRYAVGSVFIAVLYLGFSTVAVVALLMASGGGLDVESLFDDETLPPAALLAVVMVPSLGLLLGSLAVSRWLHQRSLRTLFTSTPAVRWRRVGLGAGVWFALTAVVEVLAFALDPGNYSWALDLDRFVPVAVVALLLVPLQSAAEELFFRGYLLQGLGVLLGRPWAAVLITSVGFGVVHGANPEMAEFGRVFLLYYIGMGVLLALVTLLDGGLELAIGVHVANNLYGSLAVSFPGSVLDMPTPVRMASFPVGQMSLLGAVAGLALYLVLRRIGNWPPVRSVLVSRVSD